MTQEERLKQLIMDYKNCFLSESGKRVVENLSRECYENAVTFIRNEPDSTAFNEGKRYVLLHIKRILSKNPNETRPESVINDSVAI